MFINKMQPKSVSHMGKRLNIFEKNFFNTNSISDTVVTIFLAPNGTGSKMT